VQHQPAFAEITQSARLMADDKGTGVFDAILKDRAAFAVETRIADGCGFVDQIGVKLNAHRQPKREPRPHAGGIGFDRIVKLLAEFGKVEDEVDKPFVCTVPASGATKPETICNNVDLPAPFAPKTAIDFPDGRSTEMRFSTQCCAPRTQNDFDRLCSLIIATPYRLSRTE